MPVWHPGSEIGRRNKLTLQKKKKNIYIYIYIYQKNQKKKIINQNTEKWGEHRSNLTQPQEVNYEVRG